MAGMIEPIRSSFGFSNFIVNLVLSDLKNEDAIKRARDPEGASITWIIGHLLHYRCEVLDLLGVENKRDFKDFAYDPASDGSDYPDVSEMLQAWNEVAGDLDAALEKVTDEYLLSEVEDSHSRHNEKRRLDAMTFYYWHEPYHIGALGMIRKQLGYPATSDLAIEASKSSES